MLKRLFKRDPAPVPEPVTSATYAELTDEIRDIIRRLEDFRAKVELVKNTLTVQESVLLESDFNYVDGSMRRTRLKLQRSRGIYDWNYSYLSDNDKFAVPK